MDIFDLTTRHIAILIHCITMVQVNTTEQVLLWSLTCTNKVIVKIIIINTVLYYLSWQNKCLNTFFKLLWCTWKRRLKRSKIKTIKRLKTTFKNEHNFECTDETCEKGRTRQQAVKHRIAVGVPKAGVLWLSTACLKENICFACGNNKLTTLLLWTVKLHAINSILSESFQE